MTSTNLAFVTNAVKRRRIQRQQPILHLQRTIHTDSRRSQVAKPQLRKEHTYFTYDEDEEEDGDEDNRHINDDSKDTVAGYIDWLYHHNIEGYESYNDTTMYQELAQLYLFGYQIEEHGSCNAVLEEIFKSVDHPRTRRVRLPLLDESVLLTSATSTTDQTAAMTETQRGTKRRRSVPPANISSIRDAKPTRQRYTSNIITIKVGPDLTALTVHEDRLRHSSDYSKAALSKNWAEVQHREIILADENLDIVTAYIDFLNGRPILQHLPASNVEFWLELANLYVFGEYAQDPKSYNAGMSVILRHTHVNDGNKERHCPSVKFIRAVYEGTAGESPVRKSVVQFLAD